MLSTAPTSRPSFERVYRDQFEFVWRTLRALGVADDAVDDAVQDVFLVVHRRLPEFEGRASIKTWAYEVARRVALRYRTRTARDAARHGEMPELAARDDLDSEVDQARANAVMREFLWGLDEDRRRAYMLSEFWEMPGREIAETLGANMNTIYARIRSARTELDRLAKRLHARDAGAVARSVRSNHPSDATRRRAYAAVLTSVGTSVGAKSAGMGILAWGLGALSVGMLAVRIALPADPPAEPVAAPTTRASDPSPSPPPGSPAPRRSTPSAPSPQPVQRSAAVVPVRRSTPRRPPATLEAELAQLRKIRAALKQERYPEAGKQIAAYRAAFPRGDLRPEVDALDVERACKVHTPDARDKLTALERSGADATLLLRLKNLCEEKIAPQTPTRTGTPQ